MATEYYQIMLTFSVLSGIGGVFLNTPAFAIIGHWFNKRRGFAIGIAATAGSIGGVIFPLILRSTLPNIGLPWSMRTLGFISLLFVIPSYLLLRTRPPPSEKFKSAAPDLRAFKDPKLVLCCGRIFFMEYGVLIPLTYIVSYATQHGFETRNNYLLPALINAGSVVGRAIPGLLSDKFGRFDMLILTVGACTISAFALWLPAGSSRSIIIAFTIVLGIASRGNVSLIPVYVGQLCDSRDYGRFLSSAMLMASFGTLTGLPVYQSAGLILGSGDDDRWRGLILFCGFSYLLSFIFYVATGVLAVGWGLEEVY